MFTIIDEDESGELDKKEFTKFLNNFAVTKESAEEVFDTIDSDGNGTVNLEEFLEAVKDHLAEV